MSQDDLATLLADGNPFANANAGDPWEAEEPDYPELHGQVFDHLLALSRQVRAQPGIALAALVLGEAGSGKTHLVGRLRARGETGDPPFLLAYVQPILNPKRPFRHLLKEIATSLQKPVDARHDLLDLIAARLAVHYLPALKLGESGARDTLLALQQDPMRYFRLPERTRTALEKRLPDLIRLDLPGLAPQLPGVLFAHTRASLRLAAGDWFLGETLSEEARQLLGVPDRAREKGSALEEEARSLLLGLTRMLARADRSLVVCFDRLENLDRPDRLHAFGVGFEFLVDQCPRVLPVVLARGLQWQESIAPGLNQHVRDRLEGNRFLLENPTRQQALGILGQRVARLFGPRWILPWTVETFLEGFEEGIHTPRHLLIQANEILRRLLGQGPVAFPSTRRILEMALEQGYQSVCLEPGQFPPDRDRLRQALLLLLERPALAVSLTLKPLKGKADLLAQEGAPGNRQVFCLVDAEQHHLAVGAVLKEGIALLRKHPGSRALLVRDGRHPIPARPKWPVTNDQLDAFRDLGGELITLNQNQIARWRSLELLESQIRSGDLVQPGVPPRPVTREELVAFVGEALARVDHPDFGALLHPFLEEPALLSSSPPPPRKKPSPRARERLADDVGRILARAPARLLSSRKILEALDPAPGLEELLAAIAGHPDRFAHFRGQDGVMVMLYPGKGTP